MEMDLRSFFSPRFLQGTVAEERLIWVIGKEREEQTD